MSDLDLIKYWDGDPGSKPDRWRENDEGYPEALWIGTEKADGEEHVVYLARLQFLPDSFVYSVYEDQYYLDQMSGDPFVHEDGEPLFTEFGQEYRADHVKFGRRKLLMFLQDVLGGRLKREAHPGTHTYSSHFWVRSSGTVAERGRLPRDKNELARWISGIAEAVLRAGSGGDWESELPDID